MPMFESALDFRSVRQGDERRTRIRRCVDATIDASRARVRVRRAKDGSDDASDQIEIEHTFSVICRVS